MSRVGLLLLTVLLAAATSSPQTVAPRAWQQRVDIEVPLPIPMLPLASVNPFSTHFDDPPKVLSSEAPRRLRVAGAAVAAAYVDSKGECLGAVPLELPFPGLTSALVEDLSSAHFEPARVGQEPHASWTVIEVEVEGTVRESSVSDQSLEPPDPAQPPVRASAPNVAPSGNLAQLTATPHDQLTAVAVPRRIRFKAPGRATEVPVRALVHLTADGVCDRFVALDLDAGLDPWLSTYLATWHVEPARRDGTPVDCWMVLTARVQMQLSALVSGSFRALPDRSYNPG